MPEVINWQDSPPMEAVERAVGTLREGGIVAFPTEGGYELAGWSQNAEAISRLQGAAKKPLTLAVAEAAEVHDWLPDLGMAGRRLARRSWPGPLTLVSEDGIERGLVGQLPEEVRTRLDREGALGFRSPASGCLYQVLRLLPGLALGGAGYSNIKEVLQIPGVDLVVDEGPLPPARQPTMVRVAGERWHMVFEGAVSAAELERMTSCQILFVCTGNTCRSPLAEALCGKLLAERLECSSQELPGRGFVVQSAGISAIMGLEAAPEAVLVAREMGVELSWHRSRPLSRQLLEHADYLFAMTRSHLQILTALGLPLASAPRLLSGSGDDIPDPIGSPLDVYRKCAATIVQNLETLLPELHKG